MRDILFRGKKESTGDWVFGDLRHYRSGKVGIHSDILRYTLLVDPETVGQFTGLRDCKRTAKYPEGQMIFEGDIVVCDRHINDEFDKKTFFVRECDFRFGLVGESLSGNEIRGDEWEFAEVIGNIYDNPDLLKEGGE